jgi:1,4-alpha-glucan branching enzyme
MTMPHTGERIYRLPAWINYVTQDLNVSATYDAIFWNPASHYVFKNPRPKRPESIRVYEAHGNV